VLVASWGDAERDVERALDEAESADVASRLWRRDATLWSSEPAVHRTIANRLGWLGAVEWAAGRLEELVSFGRDVAVFRDVLLLGMGGSSLAPEVLSRTYGRDLTVLDSTDPTEVLATASRLDPAGTLHLVASKSGETIETRSHAAYFLARRGEGGGFVAVTDAGSALEELARERGFRHVFQNPSDIGGRYSALSYFGLVPATAIGIDVAGLLERARQAVEACRAARTDSNPGLRLGAALGELALGGRDKVTFIASSGFEAFGAWAEQLLAESTGKKGLGIVPVDGEPLGPPDVYGEDRVFVHLQRPGDQSFTGALRELAGAGHPVLTLTIDSPDDLGAQFFLWEFATAVAGWSLGINPFDEPNVSESKENTARLIETFVRDGALPEEDPVAAEDGLLAYDEVETESVTAALESLLRGAKPGRYVALQAFIPRTPPNEDVLRAIRTAIRDRRRVATTVGFGPRYLHSTGQLHKGGPDTGLFVQITAEHPEDAPIPDAPYTFGVLQAAQAAGDVASLRRHDRRVLRVHLADGVEPGLRSLDGLIRRALEQLDW
jgi:glucose-6-phosphate isomerase